MTCYWLLTIKIKRKWRMNNFHCSADSCTRCMGKNQIGPCRATTRSLVLWLRCRLPHSYEYAREIMNEWICLRDVWPSKWFYCLFHIHRYCIIPCHDTGQSVAGCGAGIRLQQTRRPPCRFARIAFCIDFSSALCCSVQYLWPLFFGLFRPVWQREINVLDIVHKLWINEFNVVPYDPMIHTREYVE